MNLIFFSFGPMEAFHEYHMSHIVSSCCRNKMVRISKREFCIVSLLASSSFIAFMHMLRVCHQYGCRSLGPFT